MPTIRAEQCSALRLIRDFYKVSSCSFPPMSDQRNGQNVHDLNRKNHPVFHKKLTPTPTCRIHNQLGIIPKFILFVKSICDKRSLTMPIRWSTDLRSGALPSGFCHGDRRTVAADVSSAVKGWRPAARKECRTKCISETIHDIGACFQNAFGVRPSPGAAIVTPDYDGKQ